MATKTSTLDWPGAQWEHDQFTHVRLSMLLDRQSDRELSAFVVVMGDSGHNNVLDALEATADNLSWCVEMVKAQASRLRLITTGAPHG